MPIQYTIGMDKIIKIFGLDVAYLPCEASKILVSSADVNRPGLQMCGYFDIFDNQRIQIIGRSEYGYIEGIDTSVMNDRFDKFFALKPVAVMITRGLEPLPMMLESARKYEVPLLTTDASSSSFMSGLIAQLSVDLAPRVTRHGVLVEVYGEGILLLGDSGVGKSETAVELIKRGHRLIADDAVEIKRVSDKTLVGSSPENIRHFLELRGIGIINARRIFGMGAVKVTEKIDMIINLEAWDQNKVYDRMGLENEYSSILDIKVPSLTIPVKPGRNLAIIIEVAAMNNRQKKMGYNAATELLQKLGMTEDIPKAQENDSAWDEY